MNFFYPQDLADIFRLLKKAGIKKFESSLPSIILDFIYNFVWDILYKSKKISKYSGRVNITKNDIEIACKLQLEHITFDSYNFKEKMISFKALNSLYLNKGLDNEKINLPFEKVSEKNFKIKHEKTD